MSVVLCVIGEEAKRVDQAVVTFVDATGTADIESAEPCATTRANFTATHAIVTAKGYATATVTLASGRINVTLERVYSTIGTATVATGSRSSLHESPLAVSVLDSQALAATSASTSDRLLRDLPGFDRTRSNSEFTNYGQLRVSFSGAGNDRGAVFVDGIPAQDGFGGQVDWPAYDAQSIQRVELLRGAGSSLYGSGAVGGVLNVTTFGPPGPQSTPSGSLSLSGGTDDAKSFHAALHGPLGGKFSGSLEGSSQSFAYADLAPGYTTPIDQDARSTNGTFAAKLRYDDTKTSVTGSIDADSDHQDEGRPNYSFDRSLRQGSLAADRTIGEGLARVAYYARDTTIENLSDIFPTKPGVLRYDQHVPTQEEGFTTSYSLGNGTENLQLRIDERRTSGVSSQSGIGGVFQALGTGVEAEQGIALQSDYHSKQFEFNAGVRADRLRYDNLVQSVAASPAPNITTLPGHAEGAISPRAAARYDVNSRLAVRASTGGGFRGPYLNELVRGFNVGKIFEAPNLGLVPERSATASAGADYLVGSGRLALDFVETRVHDAIAFVTLSPTLMMRENIDRTQSDAETLSYTAPLYACARIRVSGTAQHAVVTAGPAGALGKALAYVPNTIGDIALESSAHGGFGYGFDATYAGQTYADDLEQQPLGAALLFGGTIHAATHSGTVFELLADNITRQRYLSSIDRYGPPQNAVLRVTVPLGPTPLVTTSCR